MRCDKKEPGSYEGTGELLGCGQMGKQLDIISCYPRMSSGAVVIVGIKNHLFNCQTKTKETLRMKSKLLSWLTTFLVE